MKRYPPYKYILALLDWILINIAFTVALKFHSPKMDIFPLYFPFITPEVLFFLVYALGIILIFQHHCLYRINVFLTVSDQVIGISRALFQAAVGFALLSFFTESRMEGIFHIVDRLIVDSRLIILYFALISFGLLLFFRVFLFRNLFLFLTKNHLYHRSLLIIGAGRTGKSVAANLRSNNPYGLQVIGFLDDKKPVGSTIFKGLKVLGKVSDTPYIVDEHRINEILVCLDNVSHIRLLEVIGVCLKTRALIKIASPLYEIIPTLIPIERYGNVPVVAVSNSTPNTLQRISKRVFDLFFTSLALLLLAPVLVIIAIAIKIDSRGPILFKQTRIGKNGKPFQFYKFRSMYLGSDKDETRKQRYEIFIREKKNYNPHQKLTKIIDESRITRVGRFIRKTSLDELPQLINVLKGDMSLVGPRPCLPYEWERYEDWHKKRLSVTPGCTGVWQVSGRSRVGFEDMVILDLFYIHNAWWLLDLQLILKTIPVMIFGRGGK
ncbi:MAG TPA: sugar transferase [Candidatus Limnocylindrales bacterium]|nr:sugar transferase [Candidatus Limnocylindrales bacterium]